MRGGAHIRANFPRIAKSSMTYRPELDGLRAIAILAVLVFHSGARIAVGGFLGVDIFFVLSGYLITSILAMEILATGKINFKNFYARRALRLAPALLILIFAVCIGSAFFLPSDQARANWKESLIALLYFSNWSRAFNIHAPGVLGHTWSLSIEEQFYLLWPALLVPILKFSRRELIAARFVVYLLAGVVALRMALFVDGATPERLYNGLDTRADALLIGSALAIWLISDGGKSFIEQRYARMFFRLAGPLSAVGLAIVFFRAHWSRPYMFLFGYLAIGIMSGTLLVHALHQPQAAIPRFLRSGPLVWIGTLSYGLYLYHYPIFWTMRRLGYSPLTIMVGGGLATFAIATLSYYMVEKRIILLKRRFTGDQPSRNGAPGLAESAELEAAIDSSSSITENSAR